MIFAPIELLEERYSSQWYQWFIKSFSKFGITPMTVGDTSPRVITTGQFLDVHETCAYKAQQMADMIHLVRGGFEGTILLMDGWFPGIEHLAYMRDNGQAKIKIVGILHAGTWDPWDFLSQNGCGRWAKYTERGWFEIFDRIILATNFHRELIKSNMVGPVTREFDDKVKIAMFPVYRNDQLAKSFDRDDIVVFPHRLAAEKRPKDFEAVEDMVRQMIGPAWPNLKFIRSKDVCRNKVEYYELLAKSKVAFSSAEQETFGIAMLEAQALGCVPVCPDRLSYVETMQDWPRYRTLTEAAKLIVHALEAWSPVAHTNLRYRDNADDLIQKVLE